MAKEPQDALHRQVETFFQGQPPADLSEDMLRQAMMRQVMNCHAMIGFEFTRALGDEGDEPDEFGDNHPRSNAYGRVEQFSGALRTMMKALQPPDPPAPPAAPDIKRDALQIEVVRCESCVRTVQSAPVKPAKQAAIRWPREAYCDDDGVFNADLYEGLETDPEWDLNEAREMWGYKPFNGPPLPPE